jgi:mannosyl-glycoprotein endo-beta-N-acetylglucosaminidase
MGWDDAHRTMSVGRGSAAWSWLGVLLLLVLTATGGVAAERNATVPLPNLKALSDWKPSDAPWNAARQALRPRRSASYPLADLWVPPPPRQDARGRVITMHDMGGGYNADQDKFPSGTTNKNLYRFTYWQYIDTFIYFSHARVNYPPPGWTDSAHRNGVKSLGTFNIEGMTGESLRDVRELLDSPSRRRFYAKKLAQVARAYGFDGYLVNIETPLPGDGEALRRRVQSLAKFVRELRREMRKVTTAATVIWYDSITLSGDVDYQNELNRQNELFFDAAGAITVNYDWSPPLKDGSPEHSAKVAGPRARDVFSSVDVFCRESGRKYCGFQSYLGARAALRAGTSFGLFAQAWTYEGDGAKPDHSNFAARERHFWTGTEGEVRPVGGVAEFVAARPVPSALPFSTRFDQGFGDAVYKRGAVVRRGPWGNVGDVDVLPTWRDVALAGSPSYRSELTTTAAFEGGSSLRVRSKGTPRSYTLRPLFRTSFKGARRVTSTVRESGLAAATVLVAARPDGDGPRLVLVLLPPGKDRSPPDVRYEVAGETTVVHLKPVANRTENGWSTRAYDVSTPLEGLTVGAIGVLAYPKPEAEAGANVLVGGLDLR